MSVIDKSSLYTVNFKPHRTARGPFTERGALRFLIPGSSSLLNVLGSLEVLAGTSGPVRPVSSNYFFLRQIRLFRSQRSGSSFSASLLLHCLFLALLLYVPILLPADDAALLSTPLREAPIYYRVPVPEAAKMPLPRIIPAGGGGRPGSGSQPAVEPSKGSSVPQPAITIVSKPVHPDNPRQTIYQASSPPDLKITTDLKLPNIVLGQASPGPKALFSQSDAKPIQTSRKISDVTAPVDTSPLTTSLQPVQNEPRLAIPISAGGAPLQRSASSSSGLSAASLEGQDLMILGVDPDSSKQFSLPEGTRWGEFSIAPPTGSPGSPSGDLKGTVGAGDAGGALGGSGSTGVGAGRLGGGGGNSGLAGPVSISGSEAGAGSGASLALVSSGLVYPIPAPMINARRNSLVVSTGPIGGGGINAYGALHCGNIYSVFLPMPGKSWSLQYCEAPAAGQKGPSESQPGVVHLQNPLLPPDADLSQRFDFKRLPVPIEKAHRAILLQGVIGVDGHVQNLSVYQSVLPEMDEAAKLAFSRWHFKPAIRDGKAVAVEILVGIPPQIGEDRVNR
jgi:Gram-negative bacterial TonB protein C-terminal